MKKMKTKKERLKDENGKKDMIKRLKWQKKRLKDENK